MANIITIHHSRKTYLFFILGFVGIIVVIAAIASFIFLRTLPSVDDANKRVLTVLQQHKGSYLSQPIPEKIGDAIVSVEDRRFYQHHGLDVLGLLKTIALDLMTTYPNGGATIDEQLAKNLYVPKDMTVWEKIQVAGIAVKLDAKYSKTQILCMYLNTIYYGHQEYGIKQASMGYFHKSPYELDWAEASMLAGLPQAPTYYNPIKNLEAAKFRQKIVLDALVRSKYITPQQEQDIYNEKLAFL